MEAKDSTVDWMRVAGTTKAVLVGNITELGAQVLKVPVAGFGPGMARWGCITDAE